MIEDAELLRCYAEARSETAFAELVGRRIGLVYSVALRTTRDAHRAEDVTQTVFADLARKAKSLANHPVLAGWLFRSAHFAALDLVRAERNRAAREQEAQTMQENLGSAGLCPEWEKIRPVLDQAMSELNECDRDAIMLRFFDGRPFADIGARLQLTENSARMRVERALDKLHALLSKRGVTSTASALGVALANQAVAVAPVGLATSVTAAALASADLTAATAVGILQFMTTTKFVASAAAIIGFLALGTAGYQINARHQAEASLAAANQSHAARAARLRGVEQSARAAEQEAARLKETVEAAQAKAAADAQVAKAAKPWNRVAEGGAFLRRHPEVMQAYIDYADAGTKFNYGRFFKSRALTPAQIDEFLALMRFGVVLTEAVTVDGKKAVLTPYETGMAASEVQRRLRILLGEEGYKEFVDVFPTRIGQRYTSAVASALSFTETPLTPDQADQLIEIVSASHRLARSKGLQWEDADWDATDVKAQGVLTAAQLPAWNSVSALGRAGRTLATAQASSSKNAPTK